MFVCLCFLSIANIEHTILYKRKKSIFDYQLIDVKRSNMPRRFARRHHTGKCKYNRPACIGFIWDESEDIFALVDDSLIKDDNVITLKSLKVFAGTGEPQKAEMTLEVYGEIKKASETGDGPVDAIFKSIKKLYPFIKYMQ